MALQVSVENTGGQKFRRLLASVPSQNIAIQTIRSNHRFNDNVKCLSGIVQSVTQYDSSKKVGEMLQQNKLPDNLRGPNRAMLVYLKDKRHSGPQNCISIYFFSTWAHSGTGFKITKGDRLQLWGDDVVATRDPISVGGADHLCRVIVTSWKNTHAVNDMVGPSVHVLLSTSGQAKTQFLCSTSQEELQENQELRERQKRQRQQKRQLPPPSIVQPASSVSFSSAMNTPFERTTAFGQKQNIPSLKISTVKM